MNAGLLSVAQSGSVDALYSLIQEDPHILHNIDKSPFIHTPLHEASCTGKIDLAMELMILKPSFAKKLNPSGFSPLHLAVENHQVELALELVKFDPSLIRVRGNGGMTSLHLVAKKGGDVDLLTHFLLVCPESIIDANVKGETALHIAVVNKNYEELKVIRGWIQRMRRSDASSMEIHVLDRRDRDDNTALHLAASDNDNHEAVKQLLKCMPLNRNILNKNGMTALDVLRANGPHMNTKTEKIIKKAGGKSAASLSKVKKMSDFLRAPVTFWEYCSTEIARYRSQMSTGTRNALLVITALMITATYETAVTPEEKDETKDIGPYELLSKIVLLWGFNTTAFFLSIVLTFILLPPGREYIWWYVFITGPLICSYAVSVVMKYDLDGVPLSFFINLYILVVSGVVGYLLLFYVRWKRTTQKKIPDPKTQLTSEPFITIV